MRRLLNFGETLRALRTEGKRSQRDLAGAAHVTQAQIDRIEHNQVDPRYSTVRRLLTELGYELVAVQATQLSLIADVLETRGEEKPLIDYLQDQELS